MLGGIEVPNCTAFSPDGGTLYFTDTPTNCIRAFALDAATGALSAERQFASVPAVDGHPDGATIDAEGGLWVAHWDGWRISRFRPDGSLDRSIRLPVPRPTCLAFGGAVLGRCSLLPPGPAWTKRPLPMPRSPAASFPSARRDGLPEPRFRRRSI